MTNTAQVEPKQGNSTLASVIARRRRAGYGRGALISIVFSEGPLAGQRVELDREMTLGRTECDVTLDDHQVSRRHLVLRPSDGELFVEDLGSTNGTVVDGERIDAPKNVADGAVIHVGTSEFIVQVAAPAPAAESQRTALAPAPVAVAPAGAAAGGLPGWFWSLAGLVEIGLILTAASLLVYYAAR
jgi:pSer/pThr/pTyr-binding forkhead associated (FHA) protein